MIIKTLYRVKRLDGGTDITLIKPSGEYTETYRLIADEGKVLTDGVNEYICIDTDYPDKYTEVEEAQEADYINALEEMGVEFNE